MSSTEIPRYAEEVLRRALREELGYDYISTENFLMHPDMNAQFTLRGYNPYVTPVTVTFWGDANKALEILPDYSTYLVYVDGSTSLYSKRAFKYGVFGFQARLPDPATDPAFKYCWLGAETTGGGHGGITSFHFVSVAGALKTYLLGCSINLAGTRAPDISALLPVNPSAGLYRYIVKVNRASVEYWVESSLVGIIQFHPESDTYDVRTTAPYYLGQVKGHCPTVQSAFLEWVCSAKEYIGKRSNIQLQHIWITDGDPAPPRTLHPVTGGVKWKGITISSGTLTSDRIPIAGYDNKTVLFIADKDGTLYIDVDYGDNDLDQYDSVSTSANTLKFYPVPVNALWLRLRFTPTVYPATVIRARVVMS